MGDDRPQEVTLRERAARTRVLFRRALSHWKVGLLLLALGVAVTLAVAFSSKRLYRSEAVILVKRGVRADDKDEEPSAARVKARLEDTLKTRSRFEAAIKTFRLYPQIVEGRGLLEATEEMKVHVGFRASEGGHYVISFEGDDQDTVQKVTQFLAESLRDETTKSNVGDLSREAEFLAGEERSTNTDLENKTKAVTVFLSEHPEFSTEAVRAAMAGIAGAAPGGAVRPVPSGQEAIPKGVTDETLLSLYRHKSRVEAQIAEATGVKPAASTAPASSEAREAAQADVEAAQKRLSDAEADLHSKASLTEDHPDMRAAKAQVAAARGALLAAKQRLVNLAPKPVEPLPAVQAPTELLDKLKQVEREIAERQREISAGTPGIARTVVDAGPRPSSVVDIETDWQKRFREMTQARTTHDDIKVRAEKARLALAAAEASAKASMQIVEPAYRPTKPSKGGRTNVAITGGLVSLLLALLYMCGRVAFSDLLIDPEDVEALGVMPVLGVIPRLLDHEGKKHVA